MKNVRNLKLLADFMDLEVSEAFKNDLTIMYGKFQGQDISGLLVMQ